MAPHFFRGPKSRRAVSELVAASVLLVATLVGFGVYYGVFLSNLSLSTSTLIDQFHKGVRVSGQQIDLAYDRFENAGPLTTAFKLYVYNYGFANYPFYSIIVITDSGNKYVINSASTTVKDCSTTVVAGDCSTGAVQLSTQSSSFPQPFYTLPVKKLYRIEFTVPDVISSPLKIALVGTDGRDFQWRI